MAFYKLLATNCPSTNSSHKFLLGDEKVKRKEGNKKKTNGKLVMK
jgi:hypothetical protein